MFRNQLEQVLCAEEMTREFKHILFPKPPPEKPGWADLSALQIRSAKERGVPPFREVPVAGDVSVKMVWIPPGTFVMGDDGGKPDQKPAHSVTLKEGFYIGVSEVTNAQWDAVMGSGSGGAADPSAPVDGVSWNACQDFLSRLNALSDLTYWGYRFRLPTEAEWEYVARTGFPDPRKNPGIRSEGTPASATPAENGASRDRSVAKRETGTDSWGVADMQGGVPEWCSDIYLHDYYRDAPQEDPRGGKEAPRDVTLLKEPLRVFRGGAANGEAWSPAHRGHAPPGEQNGGPGFRLVLEIPESGSPR
jgi:formylglycine-generating enzyme required for sulfatase activity